MESSTSQARAGSDGPDVKKDEKAQSDCGSVCSHCPPRLPKIEQAEAGTTTGEEALPVSKTAKSLLSGLGFLDRFLTVFILLAMILGVIIGKFAPGVYEAFSTAKFRGVSAPLVVGLIVMMWPILTKVQYERLPEMFSTRRLWHQIGISLILNWIVGPFIMLGLAWATLPDLEEYRTGVIMVGLARCIAMVMIWNQLAHGDPDTCAIIVIVNSLLQIVLYSPYCLWFINVMSHPSESIEIEYGDTAIAVLIYLGIPLVAGVVTRAAVMGLFGKKFFYSKFVPYFSPLALIGLLYTIIIIFAEQATNILDHLGPTFRVFVPMILYFCIMWTGTFFLSWTLTRRKGGSQLHGYEMAVVQSFTAGSNNFELAIAIAIAIFGADSRQALAATIGPLVEVPVLLALTYLALYFGRTLSWDERPSSASTATGTKGTGVVASDATPVSGHNEKGEVHQEKVGETKEVGPEVA